MDRSPEETADEARNHSAVNYLLIPNGGALKLRWSAAGVRELSFVPDSMHPPPISIGTGIPEAISKRLLAYFSGEEAKLVDLPIDPRGTNFQRRVWAALRGIGRGQTCSYGHLANQIGNPGASRAVGAAMAHNPITLLIPCHRVLPGDGKIGAYSAAWPQLAGPLLKRLLLRLEGHRFRNGRIERKSPRSSAQLSIAGLSERE